MPLLTLLYGPDSHSIVLLTDCQRNPALALLKSCLVCVASQVDTVHIYLCETKKDQLLNGLSVSVSAKVKTHDLLRDALGWDTTPKSDSLRGGYLPTCNYTDRYAVVIDSISPLILHSSPHRICQWLHSLTKTTTTTTSKTDEPKCDRVLTILHKDLHDLATLRMLEHTADSVVYLDDELPFRCKVVDKGVKGKKLPRITHETFTVDEHFGVRSEIVSSDKTSSTAPAKNPADVMSKLTDNLTFNSTVSREDEREARSKLVLPYVHTGQSTGGADTRKDAGEAAVEMDDEEFEDLDDDLDI